MADRNEADALFATKRKKQQEEQAEQERREEMSRKKAEMEAEIRRLEEEARRQKEKQEEDRRLEFLGDAVLEVTISDYVFREYPSYNEGRLTKLRSSLVCEYTLAICARDVELGKYILLSRGEDATGGRETGGILSFTDWRE